MHVLSEPSELSKLSELIELPEVFSSMKKCLFCGALRLGDPLIKLLELRFVSLSSETSRSIQTSQSSQSSITSCPVFPDVEHGMKLGGVRCELNLYIGSPVTVAYGTSEDVLESSWSLGQRWMEMVHQAQRVLSEGQWIKARK